MTNNFDLSKWVGQLRDQGITRGDWWALREYKENTQFRMARNGKNTQNALETTHGVMVEVMIAGHVGYAATDNLSLNGFKKAFEKAEISALSLGKNSLHKFTDWESRIRPAHKGSYKSPARKELSSFSGADATDYLLNISGNLRSGKNVMESMAYMMLINTDIRYISSNGSDWNQEFSILTKDFSATAQRDSIVQKRSLGMQGHQIGAEGIADFDAMESCDRLVKEVNELLDAPECPTDKRDLILMPDQLYLQVHESIGHPLELDRILGDERNYAGWSFVSPEDFGKLQYGPKILNVTFDPTISNEMASYNYDDNGVPATKEYLIKEGTLVAGIGGVESQQRSGLKGASCARACSWNRPAMDRMANINIEPGESSMEEMIKATENGILMETNRSWSIDDYRNKFQFGCEYGRLIKDGEVKEVVKNPNYRGSTVAFWNGLAQVGNKDTFEVWGSPYCGKGEPNQVIRVGHAIPTCRFTDIDVFGGA